MDPLEMLRGEHVILLSRLSALEKLKDESDLREAVEEFDDELQLHLKKENQILIPALRGILSGKEAALDAIMTEHDRITSFIGSLRTETRQPSQEMIELRARASALVREHISKEENILFWMADLKMDVDARVSIAANLAKAKELRGVRAQGPRLIDEMPIFRTENAPPFDHEHWRLSVNGFVKKPLRLSYHEILKLPRARLTADFTCVEGWRVKDVEWEGVRVKTLIDLAEPRSSARYAVFKAEGFTTTLALSEASRDETILAHRHRGQPLTLEHGAPLRLIYPSQECFESVKWVDGIELREKYLEGTGKKIALARLKGSWP